MKFHWSQNTIYKRWITLSLRKKITVFMLVLISVVTMLIGINIVVINYTVEGFRGILNENAKSQAFQEALLSEEKAFKNYIKNKTAENEEDWNLRCIHTERCLLLLNYEYDQIGEERYAKTWSIRNGYESYVAQRDYVLGLTGEEPYFVSELYKTYNMQEYLKGYALTLTQLAITEGNRIYQEKATIFLSIPNIMIVLSLILIVGAFYLAKILYQTIVNPIVGLAKVSNKITNNDFSSEMPTYYSNDEIGELVHAFVKMQGAIEDYVVTLEEKNEIAEKLHKEEIEKMEVERKFEQIKLELLKSQIHPHFLFNTLNMISCMAQLEEAETTEKMTKALSGIFRYNLKLTDSIVTLEKELKVVKDYMYIQQMRFSTRVSYRIDCLVDSKRIGIPSHTLQPLVENAIIHGISLKEKGGRLVIRIFEEEGHVIVSIADTGKGMSREKLVELREELKNKDTALIGIGLGNIYQRVQIMFITGNVEIYSKEGEATVVQMRIPRLLIQGDENA